MYKWRKPPDTVYCGHKKNKLEMWWLFGTVLDYRVGGPRFKPASLTVENSEDRQGHCVVCIL